MLGTQSKTKFYHLIKRLYNVIVKAIIVWPFLFRQHGFTRLPALRLPSASLGFAERRAPRGERRKASRQAGIKDGLTRICYACLPCRQGFTRIFVIARAGYSRVVSMGTDTKLGAGPGVYRRKSRFSSWIKAIALILISLMLVHDIAWAYPDRRPVVNQETLAAESFFRKELKKLEFQIIAGLGLLHSGISPVATNGYLTESLPGEREITFTESITEAGVTTAKFGYKNIEFTATFIDYEKPVSIAGIGQEITLEPPVFTSQKEKIQTTPTKSENATPQVTDSQADEGPGVTQRGSVNAMFAAVLLGGLGIGAAYSFASPLLYIFSTYIFSSFMPLMFQTGFASQIETRDKTNKAASPEDSYNEIRKKFGAVIAPQVFIHEVTHRVTAWLGIEKLGKIGEILNEGLAYALNILAAPLTSLITALFNIKELKKHPKRMPIAILLALHVFFTAFILSIGLPQCIREAPIKRFVRYVERMEKKGHVHTIFVHGNPIEIIDGSPKYKENIEFLRYHLSILPERHFNGLKKLLIVPKQKQKKILNGSAGTYYHGAESYKNVDFSVLEAGLRQYDLGANYVNYLQHEFAHYVYYKILDDEQRKAWESLWEWNSKNIEKVNSVWGSIYKNNNENRNNFVSDYAMTDAYEDFAETYAAYTINYENLMHPPNKVLDEKLMFIAKLFTEEKGGDTHISLYHPYTQGLFERRGRVFDLPMKMRLTRPIEDIDISYLREKIGNLWFFDSGNARLNNIFRTADINEAKKWFEGKDWPDITRGSFYSDTVSLSKVNDTVKILDFILEYVDSCGIVDNAPVDSFVEDIKQFKVDLGLLNEFARRHPNIDLKASPQVIDTYDIKTLIEGIEKALEGLKSDETITLEFSFGYVFTVGAKSDSKQIFIFKVGDKTISWDPKTGPEKLKKALEGPSRKQLNPSASLTPTTSRICSGTAMLRRVPVLGRIYDAIERWFPRYGKWFAALAVAPILEAAFLVMPRLLGMDIDSIVVGRAMAVFTILHAFNINWKAWWHASTKDKLKELRLTFVAPIILSLITWGVAYAGIHGWGIIEQNILWHIALNVFALATGLFYPAMVGNNLRRVKERDLSAGVIGEGGKLDTETILGAISKGGAPDKDGLIRLLLRRNEESVPLFESAVSIIQTRDKEEKIRCLRFVIETIAGYLYILSASSRKDEKASGLLGRARAVFAAAVGAPAEGILGQSTAHEQSGQDKERNLMDAVKQIVNIFRTKTRNPEPDIRRYIEEDAVGRAFTIYIQEAIKTGILNEALGFIHELFTEADGTTRMIVEQRLAVTLKQYIKNHPEDGSIVMAEANAGVAGSRALGNRLGERTLTERAAAGFTKALPFTGGGRKAESKLLEYEKTKGGPALIEDKTGKKPMPAEGGADASGIQAFSDLMTPGATVFGDSLAQQPSKGASKHYTRERAMAADDMMDDPNYLTSMIVKAKSGAAGLQPLLEELYEMCVLLHETYGKADIEKKLRTFSSRSEETLTEDLYIFLLGRHISKNPNDEAAIVTGLKDLRRTGPYFGRIYDIFFADSLVHFLGETIDRQDPAVFLPMREATAARFDAMMSEYGGVDAAASFIMKLYEAAQGLYDSLKKSDSSKIKDVEKYKSNLLSALFAGYIFYAKRERLPERIALLISAIVMNIQNNSGFKAGKSFRAAYLALKNTFDRNFPELFSYEPPSLVQPQFSEPLKKEGAAPAGAGPMGRASAVRKPVNAKDVILQMASCGTFEERLGVLRDNFAPVNDYMSRDARLAMNVTFVLVAGNTDHANFESFRREYRAIAKRYHPDMNAGNKEKEEAIGILSQINELWEGINRKEPIKNTKEILRTLVERLVAMPESVFKAGPVSFKDANEAILFIEDALSRPESIDKNSILDILRALLAAIKALLAQSGSENKEIVETKTPPADGQTPSGTAMLRRVPGFGHAYRAIESAVDKKFTGWGGIVAALAAAPLLETAFLVVPKWLGMDLDSIVVGRAMAAFVLLHAANINWKAWWHAPPKEKLKTLRLTFVAPLMLSFITWGAAYMGLCGQGVIEQNILWHIALNVFALATGLFNPAMMRKGKGNVKELDLSAKRAKHTAGIIKGKGSTTASINFIARELAYYKEGKINAKRINANKKALKILNKRISIGDIDKMADTTAVMNFSDKNTGIEDQDINFFSGVKKLSNLLGGIDKEFPRYYDNCLEIFDPQALRAIFYMEIGHNGAFTEIITLLGSKNADFRKALKAVFGEKLLAEKMLKRPDIFYKALEVLCRLDAEELEDYARLIGIDAIRTRAASDPLGFHTTACVLLAMSKENRIPDIEKSEYYVVYGEKYDLSKYLIGWQEKAGRRYTQEIFLQSPFLFLGYLAYLRDPGTVRTGLYMPPLTKEAYRRGDFSFPSWLRDTSYSGCLNAALRALSYLYHGNLFVRAYGKDIRVDVPFRDEILSISSIEYAILLLGLTKEDGAYGRNRLNVLWDVGSHFKSFSSEMEPAIYRYSKIKWGEFLEHDDDFIDFVIKYVKDGKYANKYTDRVGDAAFCLAASGRSFNRLLRALSRSAKEKALGYRRGFRKIEEALESRESPFEFDATKIWSMGGPYKLRKEKFELEKQRLLGVLGEHVPPGGSILEVGAGQGLLTKNLPKKWLENLSIVEVNEKSCRILRNIRGIRKDNVHCADAQRLSIFDDESMDIVIGLDSIDTFPDLDVFLKEAKRVLRPGGKLICLTLLPPPPDQPHTRSILRRVGVVKGDREISRKIFNRIADMYYDTRTGKESMCQRNLSIMNIILSRILPKGFKVVFDERDPEYGRMVIFIAKKEEKGHRKKSSTLPTATAGAHKPRGTAMLRGVPQRDTLTALGLAQADVPDRQPTHSPFRFPKYIWDEFQALLREKLGEHVYNTVKLHGLAWTDTEGITHFIDEKREELHLTNEALESIWQSASQAVKTAINKTSGKDKEITVEGVKKVITRHEEFHRELRKNKQLAEDFREKLETEVFGEQLTESHSFIKAFKDVYGEPHCSQITDATMDDGRETRDDNINWYIEEFLVLSMQEMELFNDIYAVIDRVIGIEDSISNKRNKIMEILLNIIWEKYDKSLGGRLDRLVLAVALQDHGGPLDALGCISKIVLPLDAFDFEGEWPKDFSAPARLSNLARILRGFGSRYDEFASQAEDLESASNTSSISLSALEKVESEYIEYLKALESELTYYIQEIKPWLDKKDKLSATLHEVMGYALPYAERLAFNCRLLRLFFASDISGSIESINLNEWLPGRKWETKVKGKPEVTHEVTVSQKNGDVPPIISNPLLLHVAIERIISNGFHAIEENRDKLTEDAEIININISPRPDRKKVQIIITSYGQINEERLLIEVRTGLLDLLTLNHRRKYFQHGIGLPFMAAAIKKMGGDISVQNIKGEKFPKVEFMIELPISDKAIKPNVSSEPQISEEQRLRAEHRDEREILEAVKHILKGCPVNMTIDVSLIPRTKGELEKNMETLARTICWHNMYGLQVRYALEDETDPEYALLATWYLREIVKKLPVENAAKIAENIGNLHKPSDKLIEVRLANSDALEALKNSANQIGPRQLFIALQPKPDMPSIPNYTAASSIGLSQAALRIATDRVIEEKQIKDQFAAFDNIEKDLKDDIMDKIRKIYKRYEIINDYYDFDIDLLKFMVVGHPLNRLDFAIHYALPPITAESEKLDELHETQQLLKQAA